MATRSMSRGEPPPVGVAILARVPVPGQAKTRLIPTLGAAGAARLQAWLLQRTLALAREARLGAVSLWYAGDSRQLALPPTGALTLTIREQPEGDLGWRMLTALRESMAPGGVLIIGTDCPALTPRHLRDAAEAMRHHDAVVIPAEDGGYVLIGMRAPAGPVFDGVEWGSERVMAQTRQRLQEHGLSWCEAEPLWDVDRPEDLSRLFALCPEARSIGVLEPVG